LVPYSVDFIVLDSQTFFFKELSNGQHPTIEYVVSWDPRAIPAWPNFQPMVGWLDAGGNSTSLGGTPVLIPAQTCLSDDQSVPSAIMPPLPAQAPGSPYTAGAQAKMCIAEQGWWLINVGTTQAPVWKIQYWDRVIDQGDGYVGGP
jgi:hypothetical protein